MRENSPSSSSASPPNSIPSLGPIGGEGVAADRRALARRRPQDLALWPAGLRRRRHARRRRRPRPLRTADGRAGHRHGDRRAGAGRHLLRIRDRGGRGRPASCASRATSSCSGRATRRAGRARPHDAAPARPHGGGHRAVGACHRRGRPARPAQRATRGHEGRSRARADEAGRRRAPQPPPPVPSRAGLAKRPSPSAPPCRPLAPDRPARAPAPRRAARGPSTDGSTCTACARPRPMARCGLPRATRRRQGYSRGARHHRQGRTGRAAASPRRGARRAAPASCRNGCACPTCGPLVVGFEEAHQRPWRRRRALCAAAPRTARGAARDALRRQAAGLAGRARRKPQGDGGRHRASRPPISRRWSTADAACRPGSCSSASSPISTSSGTRPRICSASPRLSDPRIVVDTASCRRWRPSSPTASPVRSAICRRRSLPRCSPLLRAARSR